MSASAAICATGSPGSVEPKIMNTMPPTRSAMRRAQPQPVKTAVR